MARSLGFFTAYGVEYIYDYLGQERINNKIEELKNTATMGMRLETLINADPDYCYLSGELLS